MNRVRRYLILFETFFKIGAFTLGGGYAMLPLMEREFVTRRKWITEEEMIDILAVVQSLPGIIAVKASIFIGYEAAGLAGAVIAVIGLLVPSITIITLFAFLYVSVHDNPVVQNLFIGVRAGVTALILLAGIKLGKKVLNDWLSVVSALAAGIAVWFFDVHAGLVIIAAAVLGYLLFSVLKVRVPPFRRESAHSRMQTGQHSDSGESEDTEKEKM